MPPLRSWSKLHATVGAATLAVSLLGGPAARASDDVAIARELFDEARAAFTAGRYAEAAEGYERAAAARPHPAPLVNAAEAWELDGNRVRAARACDHALALDIDAKLRAAIGARLARLTRSIGTLSVRGPAHLGVRVDDGEILRAPALLRVSPGRHRLSYVDADGRGRPETQVDVLVAAGEERAIVLTEGSLAAGPASTESASASAPNATPRDESTGGPPLGTWIAFGLGAAAAGATATFGLMTLSAKDTYEGSPTRETLDDFHGRRLATNIALGVAAASVGVGIVLWVLQSDHGGKRSIAALPRPFSGRF